MIRRDRAIDGRSVLRLANGLQIHLHNLAAGLALGLAVIALAALAASIGTQGTGLADLVRSVFGKRLDPADAYALWTVRLPRIVIGFLAGWTVALSGAILQSLARNPLADPGLFGLNQGSMVAIMLLLVFMPAAPREIVPLAALLGGLGVGLLLIGLVGGTRSGGLAILLIGLAVETVLSAITSILILYTPPETSYGLSAWLAGSLFQASWSGAAAFAPWFAVGLIGIAVFGRRLAVYDLGADMARLRRPDEFDRRQRRRSADLSRRPRAASGFIRLPRHRPRAADPVGADGGCSGRCRRLPRARASVHVFAADRPRPDSCRRPPLHDHAATSHLTPAAGAVRSSPLVPQRSLAKASIASSVWSALAMVGVATFAESR